MPNQLANSKRRQSLAEHKAVLAALAKIAETENTTVMALLRQAGRDLVKSRAGEPVLAKALSSVVWEFAPKMPARFKTAAQLARFKREQRAFDRVILDLQLATPAAIQQRNSMVTAGRGVHILELDQSLDGSGFTSPTGTHMSSPGAGAPGRSKAKSLRP